MDSVTQLVLGAAVAESVMANKVGRKAAFWGGVLGTLPDLDVFIPLGDAVKDFTYHRSASHSLIILALATPLLVWLINKIHPQHSQHKTRWLLMVYLVLATHVLLDSFTVYGTQIFWPIISTPMTWSTIFIIDPLYTLPLIIGLTAALVMPREHQTGLNMNRIGLIISTLYLCWSLFAKQVIDSHIEHSLKTSNLEYNHYLSTPTPFNTLLWRTLVKTDDGYYEGFVSLLDQPGNINFNYFPSQESLIKTIRDHWPVKQLKWFTKGFYAVSQKQNDIVISDLRMGLEPNYVFQFKVAEKNSMGIQALKPTRLQVVRDTGKLKLIWRRIWDPSIAL